MPLLISDDLGGVSSMTATPATITTTTETVVHQFKLSANNAQVGTTYRVTASGTISASSAGSLLPRLRLGTAGTTSDAAVAATAAAGAAVSAVGWYVQFCATCRTTGTTGTVLGNGLVIVNATAAQLSAQTATATMNTTVANWLSLTLTAAGTSPVITIVNAFIEIVKP